MPKIHLTKEQKQTDKELRRYIKQYYKNENKYKPKQKHIWIKAFALALFSAHATQEISKKYLR